MFWTQIRMKGDRGFRLARAAALAALIVGLLAVGSGLKGAAVIPRGLAGRPGGEETQAVAQRLAVLERGWVPNAGQWDERAAFAAPGYFGGRGGSPRTARGGACVQYGGLLKADLLGL